MYAVICTHIEDSTPGGPLPSPESLAGYEGIREDLIAMADLMQAASLQWVLQPDYKILEAARIYETPALMAVTGGKNIFRFLREDRGVVIDPHSHESDPYNYTDVAYLLGLLGVGPTAVVGGHVWDPLLDEFAEWDRFRVPVPGGRYPTATWRGEILTGAATPGHTNDPQITGVWRPRGRYHFFEHDPAANIVSVGAWKKSVTWIGELIDFYDTGVVPVSEMLTFSINYGPLTFANPAARAAFTDTVVAPLVAWEAAGRVRTTDFTTLVDLWLGDFGGHGYLYDAALGAIVDVPGAGPGHRGATGGSWATLAPVMPNPAAAGGKAQVRFRLACDADLRLSVHDTRGRAVAVVASGRHSAGEHGATIDTRAWGPGIYFCRLEAVDAAAGRATLAGGAPAVVVSQKLVVTR